MQFQGPPPQRVCFTRSVVVSRNLLLEEHPGDSDVGDQFTTSGRGTLPWASAFQILMCIPITPRSSLSADSYSVGLSGAQDYAYQTLDAYAVGPHTTLGTATGQLGCSLGPGNNTLKKSLCMSSVIVCLLCVDLASG